FARSALRELEAASGLALAVLLALDDAAVARQEALRLQHRPQLRLIVGERLADAVAERASLARKSAARHRADDIVLAEAGGDGERLVEQHAQHRAREIDGAVAAVHRDLAVAGLDPDARDGVLALARRVSSALCVELRLCFDGRRRLRCRPRPLQRVAET